MITRRGLLMRVSQLAPLAVAAGTLGRFAVPVAQPMEQEVLPYAAPIIYEEENVGYNMDGFIVDRWAGGVYKGYDRLGPAVRSIMVRAQDGVVRVMLEPWLHSR
jgi:hypothetical protein